MKPLPDAIELTVSLSHPWTRHPGQYIQLWIPTLSLFSIFQSHPFCISWYGKAVGAAASWSNSQTYYAYFQGTQTVFIQGPLGVGSELSEFGTVILVATGIGIAPILSYL
ncbi:MAG: NADPH oxidase family protein [Paenibacillus sp.]|uniref:NADPH oxidase family protein n=1 Tax=Paenibacillus sp. TaxID=58172 RepID=UPI003B7F1A92